MYSIYRYVLDASPPPTNFHIRFVPGDYRVERTEMATTSRHGPITVSLFFPYYQKLAEARKSKMPYVSAQRDAYAMATFTSCFEYMHVLFFTGRLKSPNLLSHSIADRITCSAVMMKALSAAGAHADQKLLSVKQMRSKIKTMRDKLSQKSGVYEYSELVANENISNLFGAETKPATIRFTGENQSNLVRLLKLARAMLQQPVDLTKQQLYPLNRLKAVPAYTSTPADISSVREESSAANFTNASLN
jgi:hypothetical protein